MKHARAHIGDMDNVVCHFKAVHEFHCRVSTAFEHDAHNTALSVRHIFHCKLMIWVAFETGVIHSLYFRAFFKIFSDGQSIFCVALHADSESLCAEVGEKCRKGGGVHTEVADELYAELCYICGFAEAFGVCQTMI